MVQIKNNDQSIYNIGSFVKEVSELVEITFFFIDPEDSKSSIQKNILMNITEGHCDDLEDYETVDHVTIIVIIVMFVIMLSFTMTVVTINRLKFKNENSENAPNIEEEVTRFSSVTL